MVRKLSFNESIVSPQVTSRELQDIIKRVSTPTYSAKLQSEEQRQVKGSFTLINANTCSSDVICLFGLGSGFFSFCYCYKRSNHGCQSTLTLLSGTPVQLSTLLHNILTRD